MTRLRTMLALPLAALLIALARPAAAQDAPKKIKKQGDLITREELLASAQMDRDLWTAIRALRPRFLEMPAGVRTLGNAVVPPKLLVIDGNRQPGLGVLRTISASMVAEVRHLEPSKAEGEYGMSGGSGAVVVKLYKAPPKVTKDSTP